MSSIFIGPASCRRKSSPVNIAVALKEDALSYMQTAVVVCTSNLEVLYINSAAEQLFHAATRRAGQRKLDELFQADVEFVDALVRAGVSNESISLREIILHRLDLAGPVTVDCFATPMREGQLLVELTLVEGPGRISREGPAKDFQAINRAMVQGVAHEVRNPLGGIRGAAQLLEKELADASLDASLQDYTGVIIKEADRLRDLVDRMAWPAGPSPHRRVNVHEVLEHVRTLVTSDAPEGFTIDRDYDPSLPSVQGDFDSLVQALLNIVLNAVQAVAYNGNVSLITRIERQLTIGGRRHRLVVRIDVVDDGPGVQSETIEQIFYPMVTFRDGGTGLGLSVAQTVIARHQGIIQVESAAGDTRFSIYLPADTQ